MKLQKQHIIHDAKYMICTKKEIHDLNSLFKPFPDCYMLDTNATK